MQQVVLISGAFDLLHAGHINLLKTAKALAYACGGFVVCMINSDEMIRSAKGPDRPRQTAYERQDAIFALGVLDSSDVVKFFYNEEKLKYVCEKYKPIRLLGSDYMGKPVTGAEHCKCILFIERSDDSTTKTIQSITNR